MRFNYFLIGFLLAKSTIFKKMVPLAVSWTVTARCNQRCKYCRVWDNHFSELDTKEILTIIDYLYKLGTRWISFTGGEPLLREDIGDILKYAIKKGIYTSVSSNGSLVSSRIKDLKGINRIKLSLDGDKKTHDSIRGQGSFRKVINAIKISQSKSIPVRLECVLSKCNLDCIDFLVELTGKYRLCISFQPATKNLLWSSELNPIAPPKDKYREAINKLIELKRKGAPIYNSVAGLRHLSYWPDYKNIRCTAGKLSFDITPDGTILACDRFFHKLYKNSKRKNKFMEQIKYLPWENRCGECWCSSMVEFNLISSFNINAIINFFRTY